jgi:hypothetical protein
MRAHVPAAEAAKGDVELEDEDLDAGAWGEPDLDLAAPDADVNGDGAHADESGLGGEPGEGEEGGEEGGWDMEARA